MLKPVCLESLAVRQWVFFSFFFFSLESEKKNWPTRFRSVIEFCSNNELAKPSNIANFPPSAYFVSKSSRIIRTGESWNFSSIFVNFLRQYDLSKRLLSLLPAVLSNSCLFFIIFSTLYRILFLNFFLSSVLQDTRPSDSKLIKSKQRRNEIVIGKNVESADQILIPTVYFPRVWSHVLHWLRVCPTIHHHRSDERF